jgi:hypothetical protein
MGQDTSRLSSTSSARVVVTLVVLVAVFIDSLPAAGAIPDFLIGN